MKFLDIVHRFQTEHIFEKWRLFSSSKWMVDKHLLSQFIIKEM